MSVCENQDKFNNAFYKAVQEYPNIAEDELGEDLVTSYKTSYIVGSVLGLIFLIWAIVLARNSTGDKVQNLIWAILVSPIYVIASLIAKIK